MEQKIKRGSPQFLYGITDPKQLEGLLRENQDLLIGVSFVGRSNVGKSTLINSLFGNNTCRTSKTPGRTRQVNIFAFQLEGDEDKTFYLFDLPGYGYAEVSKQMSKNWEELMTTFFSLASHNVLMVNVQDARHPDQNADQQFHQFLANFDFSTTLAFNKMDKLKKQKEKSALNKKKPELLQKYTWVKDIHFVSAENGQGLGPLEESVVSFLRLRDEALTHGND